MINIRKSQERGHANHGWLDSRHTFSFGGYHDPNQMGFRVLRVINEDKVKPDHGFGTHPHRDMEIISYVVSGELEHKDSMGNGSVILPGEFQIITAGTGITHSEFNPSKDKETHFYQIWVLPDAKGIAPRYEQKSFSSQNENKELQLVASKDGENDSLTIHQDIRLFKGALKASNEIFLPLQAKRYGWIQVVSGELEINRVLLQAGDGASITDLLNPVVNALADSEFLFFDLP